MDHKEIIDFWFSELSQQDWFAKSDALDSQIKQRFSDIHRRACLGELFLWRDTAHGRLAEIIILDQFSRNIYRGKAGSFASDAQALTLAQEAVALGLADQLSSDSERMFLYMPYMHSESLFIQNESVKLYHAIGNDEYAIAHSNIIEKFGRYPHRNEILGRASTEEELEYLKNDGQTF
jgi:uncharacterized protein (DUF924 family)